MTFTGGRGKSICQRDTVAGTAAGWAVAGMTGSMAAGMPAGITAANLIDFFCLFIVCIIVGHLYRCSLKKYAMANC